MPRLPRQVKKISGSTLTELLIVITLLAILAITALFGWRVQIAKARDAQRKESLHQLSLAFSSYHDDFGCYPPEAQITCGSTFLSPYLPEIPCDPVNNATYKFTYVQNSCSSFELYTKLEYETDSDIAKSGCGSGCGPDSSYNYVVTSEGVGGGGNIEGVLPTCGTETRYCIPSVCSECCPGTGYRCNGAGNSCISDPACGQ